MPETLDKLKSLAAKIFGAGRKEELKGEGLQRPVAPEMQSYDKTAIRFDRRSVIRKCIEMEQTDVRVARIFQKLSSDAVVGGLEVPVEQALNESTKNKAQQIIDKILETCNINRYLKGWIHNCLREGDTFLEIIVDDKTREIQRLKKLATIITFNNKSSDGNFPKNEPAYYQEHPLTGMRMHEFQPWQISQIPWEHEDGKPYGTPMFASARLAWERLDSAEKNIVIRRAIRAGMTRHHKVGTAEYPSTWEQVVDYRDRNKDSLANPMDASQDFFSTGNVDIVELKGDTAIGDIEDLQHFEGLLTMRSGVPMALLGGGREASINRDVLKEQQEDYRRVIADVNATFEYGLRSVFDFGLLLAGMNPDIIDYTFAWGAKDQDDVDRKISRALQLQALGFSFETLFKTVGLDKLDIEEELERIEKQVEDGKIPYGVGLKLDPNLLMLLGQIEAKQKGSTDKVDESLVRLADLAEKQLSVDSGSALQMLENLKNRG